MTDIIDLGMARAAALNHSVGGGRVDNQADMGVGEVVDGGITLVADGTGQGMVVVQSNGVTAQATRLSSGDEVDSGRLTMGYPQEQAQREEYDEKRPG